MGFSAVYNTDVGIKKKTNQDSLAIKIADTPNGQVMFSLVCDGMGGEELLRYQWIRLAVEQNEKIKAYGEQNGFMLGTTISAILIYRGMYYILHVGDSRVYEITSGIRQLTADQTLVAREIAAGRLTPEQAETDSRRSVLLQCIGASPVVEPDFVVG